MAVAGTIPGAATRPEVNPERGLLLGVTAQRRTEQPNSGLVINRISAHEARRHITLEVGQRDIRIRRTTRFDSKRRPGGGIRGSVSSFTKASRRRLLFTARNFPGINYMVTLTYPSDFPADGRLVKDHWRRFRQWLIRNGANTGLWVLEFQKRGAPHFHIFIRKPLDGHTVSRAWYRIVGSNDPKHLAAGTRVERFRYPPALGSYVMKYAAKIVQKEVPVSYERVGRFWGTWGKPKVAQTIRLPVDIGKHYVRYIRRAFIKQRRTWV